MGVGSQAAGGGGLDALRANLAQIVIADLIHLRVNQAFHIAAQPDELIGRQMAFKDRFLRGHAVAFSVLKSRSRRR